MTGVQTCALPICQASDILFGQEGDDIFQIVPDALPLVRGTQRTLIPTFSDVFNGGSGDDQVLFLGGDLDRNGRPVPDHVAIRWNVQLHRYEFAALVWDVANQVFLSNPAGAGFVENQAFYQALGVERTVIDTRSGDDEDRKSTRLNSSHIPLSRMPSSA